MERATTFDRWLDDRSTTAFSNRLTHRTSTVVDSTAEISEPKKPDWIDLVLEQLKAISSLKSGWDGFGAGPIRRDVLSFVGQILTQIMGSETPAPYISPMSHEGVLLEWHLPNIELEIEVETPGEAWVSYSNAVEGTSESWEIRTNLFSLAEPIAKLEQVSTLNP